MDRTSFVDPRGRPERQPDSTKRSARHRQLDLRCFRPVRTLDANQTLFIGEPQLLRLPVQNIQRRDGLVVVDLESGETRLTCQSLWTIRDIRGSASNHFTHAGTWNVLGRSRDAFSAALNDEQAATWYWFDSGTNRLARIMNIRTENDFRVAVLGAYYLVDFPSFRRLRSSNLGRVHEFCLRSATPTAVSSDMLTLADILSAMGTPPSGSQIKCTLQQIQVLIPGISYPTRALTPPS